MAKSKKKRFYAVRVGRTPGIYTSWSDCEKQVKGHSGAAFQGFATHEEARAFLGTASVATAQAHKHAPPASRSADKPQTKRQRTAVAPTSVSIAGSEAQSKSMSNSSNNADSTLDVSVYFDGGARGNPGIAGAGAEVMWTERTRTANQSTSTKTEGIHIRQYCGPNETNNVAEYTGLLVGLRWVRDVVRDRKEKIKRNGKSATNKTTSLDVHITVRGDSNLIISQMNGTMACKSANLKPLFEDCRAIASDLKMLEHTEKNLQLRVFVTMEHVYRESNKVADQLANEAMDERRSWTSQFVRMLNGEVREISKPSIDTSKSRTIANKTKAEKSGTHVVDLCSPDKEVIS